MASPFDAVRSALAGLSPRERRLLFGLLSVFGVLLFFGFYLWSASALDDLETERAAAVDALRTIRNERPRIHQRELEHQRMLARFANKAPALTSFVEEAARDPNAQAAVESATPTTGTEPFAQAGSPAMGAVGTAVAAAPSGGETAGAGDGGTADAAPPAGVTVAEATDRTSPAPPPPPLQARAASIRLRRVNLQNLVGFMDRIDNARFPVAITSIRIRKVFGERNTYDIDDMVIATWDRTDTTPTNARGATGSTSAEPPSPGNARPSSAMTRGAP